MPEVQLRSAPWIFTPPFLLAFDHLMLKMGLLPSTGILARIVPLLLISSKVLWSAASTKILTHYSNKFEHL